MKRCRTPGGREGDRHFRATHPWLLEGGSQSVGGGGEKEREVTGEPERLPRRWHLICQLVSIFSFLSLLSVSLKSADALTVGWAEVLGFATAGSKVADSPTTQISRDLPRVFNLLGSACSLVGG